MKNIEITKETIYTCDECKQQYKTPFIHFEMIDDIWMRVIESKTNPMNKHLTYGRLDVDLCSMDCWKKYLWKSMEMLLLEIVKTR